MYTVIGNNGSNTGAQKYLDEVFNESDITVVQDVVYGSNYDYMATGAVQPLPIQDLTADIYMPSSIVDSDMNRRVVVYLHSGNFLPPYLNGSYSGSNEDIHVVEVCTQYAKRGFVVIAPSYRGGWNPASSIAEIRKGTLLNAAFRALIDSKTAVRYLKKSVAEDGNPYGIDETKIAMGGVGTGGYMVQVYRSLDKGDEVYSDPRFMDPLNPGVSYIDTSVYYPDGSVGQNSAGLHLENYMNYSADVSVYFNYGGALIDTAWLEAGDGPCVTIQAVRDPNAPFDQDMLIVPTTGENVLRADGLNTQCAKTRDLGENDVFANAPAGPLGLNTTAKAQSTYGQTYAYFDPNNPTMTIESNIDGCWPMLRPLVVDRFCNPGSPWDFWDVSATISGVNAFNASYGFSPGHPLYADPNDIAYQCDNPNDHLVSKLVIDSLLDYTLPRIFVAMGEAPDVDVDVTFQVDMSNELVTSGVYLTGSFNNFGMSDAIAMNDIDGDGVYETTVTLEGMQTHSYYFINGFFGAIESVPVSCSNSNGYREITTGGDDITINEDCFNNCGPCGAVNYNITGTLSYTNSSSPLVGVDVSTSTGVTGVTDASGEYLLSLPSAGTYNLSASINLPWGGVNSTDALAVQNHVIGAVPLTGLNEAAIDVNASGSNTSADALQIRQRFVNIIQSFTSGDWGMLNHDVIVSGETTYNMEAICMGDVNASYSPMISGSNNRISTMNMIQENELLVTSNEITIPIRVTNYTEFAALSLVLDYPSTVKVKSVSMGSENLDEDLLYNSSTNQLRISWMNVNALALNSNDVLLEVTLELKDLTSTPFILVDSESELASSDINVIDNVVLHYPRLITSDMADNIVLESYPNPFSTQTQISYTIPLEGKVSVMVTNILGEEIMNIAEGFQSTGTHNLLLNGNDLTNGIYFYTISLSASEGVYTKTKKFIKR